MSANVLEIPLIADRVREALAMSHDDPSHPGQLVLDIIQAIPRPELFALDGHQLLELANSVIDSGSRRRTLLFLRADRLATVSCSGPFASRPLHHRGAAGHPGHPGPRIRWRQHRLHRASH